MFEYKCFTVEIGNGKIIIKDAYGDVIDIVYKHMSKKEIKEYIDEYFKCE